MSTPGLGALLLGEEPKSDNDGRGKVAWTFNYSKKEDKDFNGQPYLVDVETPPYDEVKIVERISFRAKYIRSMFKLLEDSDDTADVAKNLVTIRKVLTDRRNNERDGLPTQPKTKNLYAMFDPEEQAMECYDRFMEKVQSMVARHRDALESNGSKSGKRIWEGQKPSNDKDGHAGQAGMRRFLLSDELHTKESCLRYAKENFFDLFNQSYAFVKPGGLPSPRANADEDNNDDSEEQARDEVLHCRSFDKGLAILVEGLLQSDGEDVLSFLKALTFEVTDDDWLKGRLIQAFKREVHVQAGNFTCAKSSKESPEYNYDEDTIADKHPIIAGHRLPVGTEHRGLGMTEKLVQEYNYGVWKARKMEYRVFWCGVKGLFYGVPFENMDDPLHSRMMEFMYALEHVPVEALSAPLCQVFLRYHWDVVSKDYFFDRVIDVLILALFCSVAADAHTGEWIPRPHVYLLLVFLHAIVVGKVLMMTVMAFAVFGRARGPRALSNLYNFVFGFFDVYTLAILVAAYLHDRNFWAEHSATLTASAIGQPFVELLNSTDVEKHLTYHDTFPGKHPTLLFTCIGARWVYFMMQLINVSFIGRAILPVLESMKSHDTLVLMGFLCMCTVGALQTYYSFPLGDDDSDVGEAAMRVVRLFWMGDFDLFELEGVDGTVQGNVSANGDGTYNADLIEDDGDHTKWMWGIRLFTFFSLAVGPILFLNTLIAVLGEAYGECKAQINERFVKYRLNSLKLLFLRRIFLDRAFSNNGCVTKIAAWCTGAENTGSDKNGLWMRIPDSFFNNEESPEDAASVSQVQETEKKLTEKMEHLEYLLETLAAEQGIKTQGSQVFA